MSQLTFLRVVFIQRRLRLIGLLALKQFDFHGAPLRTVMIKGEPWFVAVDVCKILGIENARDAISRIKSLNVGSTDVQNSRGQLRKTKIVNESGVRRAGDPHQYDDQGSDDLGQEPGQTAAGQKRQEGRVHDHGRAEMKKHIQYGWYVLRHKWFVFQECCKRGIWLQGLIHDWSKLLPDEWGPYANFFYGNKITATDNPARRAAFDVAWLQHQHRSPHHWQHWVLRNDDGSTVALEMPTRFATEMLCDWIGAGKAIMGAKANTPAWYVKNKDQIIPAPSNSGLG